MHDLKKFLLLILFILCGLGARSQDTIYPTGFAASFQPSLNDQFFGVGVYAQGLFEGFGLYTSVTGLFTHETGERESPSPGDLYISGPVTGPKNYVTLSGGLTYRAVENFYFYAGYSRGLYQQFSTSTYLDYSKPATYTVITEFRSYDLGLDFGAIYYAGKKIPRFALQIGFNTITKTIVAGIQVGLFIRKEVW